MNQHIATILKEPALTRLHDWTYIGPVQKAELEYFVQQVVGEAVLATLATDNRQAVYTTFDKQLVDGTIQRAVNQLRNHFKDNYDTH
jgi:hypothetical protein